MQLFQAVLFCKEQPRNEQRKRKNRGLLITLLISQIFFRIVSAS